MQFNTNSVILSISGYSFGSAVGMALFFRLGPVTGPGASRAGVGPVAAIVTPQRSAIFGTIAPVGGRC